MLVSIHAPTWGATMTCDRPKSAQAFQSTRPRGARQGKQGGHRPSGVSIHAPTWGATNALLQGVVAQLFQSTRPRGARLRTPKVPLLIISFNPRAHVGRDTLHRPMTATKTLFQSTRPRGARRTTPFRFGSSQVSIHAPTWGATKVIRVICRVNQVSIHAPTWGATIDSYKLLESFKFQSTRPRGARPRPFRGFLTVTLFQSTRPRGARPIGVHQCLILLRVSIHAPTWGATLANITSAIKTVFQSTRPRGARLS